MCYVDDNKVSHMEVKLVENLINKLRKSFGGLVVNRVKKHTFWGMNINIMQNKKVEIEMKEQCLEEIDAFGEDLGEKVTTQEYSCLFIVNKQSNLLYE